MEFPWMSSATTWRAHLTVTCRLQTLGALEHLPELRELRLEGNKLRSVPWTAFRATPLLKVLDLKRNKIDALPELALQFLANLTYLDLSSNRLTVVSKSVFLNWPAYQKPWQPDCGAKIISSLVVALHDNPGYVTVA
ncbi:Leucine-rich repeat, immunoglobulin-like domain and transmembrane domain-containing protein 2 [Plecturocebus cupreus]